MNILLTGGTGFIGSHITVALISAGHKVSILARNENRIPALQQLPDVQVVRCGMHDYSTIEKLMPGHDALVHVALDYSDGAVNMLQHDTLGAVNLFEQAAKNGMQIIYTSSTAAVDFLYMTDWGRNRFAGKQLSEDHRTLPTTFYGATKAACESFLSAVGYEYGVRTNSIRPGYVFGNPALIGAPTQPDTRFRDIVAQALAGESIHVAQNDGTQFLWAADIAQVYVRLLESDIDKECFFALGKNYFTWEQIAKYIAESVHSTSEIIVESSAIPDRPAGFAVDKINKMLGLSFDDGWDKIKLHTQYLTELLRSTI